MFVVLYRWRIKPGQEEQFRAAWARATEKITARYGALGSRLHQVDDGSWLAYAQWPDRERWLLMRSGPPVAPDEFAQMQAAEESPGVYPVPFLTMTVREDNLRRLPPG